MGRAVDEIDGPPHAFFFIISLISGGRPEA